MTVYGYLRVSTVKQEQQNYKHAILELANSKGLTNLIWIGETVSGRKDWRNRLLGKEFEKMVKGDVIIMAEYSRIGRDFLQSMEFVAECRRKGVTLYSTLGDIPVNNDATSNLLMAVTAYKSQVERENLSYRTKIGIQARRDAGSIIGRPKVMILDKDVNNIRLIRDDVNLGIKLKVICKKYKCTMPTLTKFMKKHEITKNITPST